MAKKSSFRIFAGLLFCFTFFLTPAFAEDSKLSIASSINKNKTTIGTPIFYKLEIVYQEPIAILDDIPIPTIEGFEVEVSESSISGLLGGKLKLKRTFKLVPFSVGKFQIPSLPISYQEKDKSSLIKQASTESFTLQVRSVRKKTDKDDIRPNKDIVDLKEAVKKILINTAIGIGGLLLLLLALFFFKRFFKHTLFGERARLSPYETAIKKLNAFDVSNLNDPEMLKTFSEQISYVLRKYVSEIFQKEFLDLTTSELQNELKTFQIDSKLLMRLIKILIECDLVKFAKHNPSTDRVQFLLDESKETIKTFHKAIETPKSEEDSLE